MMVIVLIICITTIINTWLICGTWEEVEKIRNGNKGVIQNECKTESEKIQKENK